MLQTGLAVTSTSSRPFAHLSLQANTPAGASSLTLTGVGQPDVATGFTALPEVDTYTATAGRYRLALTGFAICATDEERLCYNSDGTFRGQYLQGADTYYSAAWNDDTAGNTSGDTAYLQPRAGGSIAYAGEHSETDIFGGTGGCVVITQTDADGSFHICANIDAPVVEGDVMRHVAIVKVDTSGMATPEAGEIGLRGSGNSNFAFSFDHDASGAITGFTESWSTYRAGFLAMTDMGFPGWYMLWVDREADATGATQSPAINYGGTSAGQGRKILVADIYVQVNPATAPSAVPVCAPSKTFAADTLGTSLSDAGYFCEGLATARSRIPSGSITAPAVPIGVPYEPLETRIGILDGVENADRSGILANENSEYYVTPWRSPATFNVTLGPAYFPSPWLVTDSNKGCTDANIIPVFQERKDLRPILGKHATSATHLTGTLNADKCIFLGVGDTVDEYFEQSSIRAPSTTSSFFLQAGTSVYARDALVMGATLHTTRARNEIQADATPTKQVYVGEMAPQIEGGAIDFSGTFVSRLARFGPSAPGASVALNLNDMGFDYIWSDFVYVSSGIYAAAQASRRFHGRATSDNDLSLWQSRNEIQVDTGSGFTGLGASGLTIADLPQGGQEWAHVGSFDFDTATFTAAPDATKSVKPRYWKAGSITGKVSKEGYQWHANQIEYGTYTRHPDQGDVFELTVGSNIFRIFYDYGYWVSASSYVTASLPAQTSTGTHTDNVQINRSDVTITSWAEHDCVFLNNGQGEFLTGLSNLSAVGGSEIDGYDVDGLVAILEANNAFRFDWSHQASSVCDVANSVFIETVSKRRLTNGGEGKMVFGSAGDNNTLNVGANVWVFSGAADPSSISSNATLTGTLNTTQLPTADNYSEYTAAGAQTVELSAVLNIADIDGLSGQAAEIADPWTFSFADTASAALGFDPNAKITAAKASHAEWNDVVDDLVSVYFREPDHYAAIAEGAAVNTVVASGITATAFHARYSGNAEQYFKIDGDDVKVAKVLTGLDRVFVLRGENDETFVVDVS